MLLVFVVVVLGFALRGMSSEERQAIRQARSSGVSVFLKDAIAKPPSGGEAF